MQSRILLRGYAREGERPPSPAHHPQNQQQQQNQEQQQNQNQEQNQGRLHRRLDTPRSNERRCHHRVRNPWLHVLITLPPRVIWFCFPHHYRPGSGRSRPSGFSYWLLQFAKGYPLPPLIHFRGSVFPLAYQSLAARRSIAPLPRLQLQIATFMSDHPVVANRAFCLQSEHLTQFAGGRLPPVIVLRLCRHPSKASVVLRQILFFQILVPALIPRALLPPQLLVHPILMGSVVAPHPALPLHP